MNLMKKPRVKRKNNISEPSSLAARHRMEAAKPRDTAPERALRSKLHKRGLRYRVDVKPAEKLNRRADIVFRSTKVAVFVDGCFWHGCPKHGTWPKQNAEFWKKKIETNIERDKNTNILLRKNGWKVIRIWEHEDLEKAAQEISKTIRERKLK